MTQPPGQRNVGKQFAVDKGTDTRTRPCNYLITLLPVYGSSSPLHTTARKELCFNLTTTS